MSTALEKVTLIGVLIAALALMLGAGTAAGQSAPDCSQVSYNGDGSEQNPYEVSNVDQLQCMAAEGSETGMFDNFVQVDDIDATETSSWNFGRGFKPIPIGTPREFDGVFDGNGYTISGLVIDRPTEDKVGLFRWTDATVRDVGLENVDIHGDQEVGALVGSGYGDLTESYATGTVEGGKDVGGLIGVGEVAESYANVNVDGGDTVGGLVGDASISIDKSYAQGDVEGDSSVGGLAGENRADVTQSYSTGGVTGNNQVGGLIGDGTFGTATNSYWDVPASGQTGSDGGTGLGDITDVPPADEMTGSDATDNMIGFGSAWATVPNDYPVLAWQLEDPAIFEVTIQDTNSPAPAGQPLSATATITNTGDQERTQAVTAEVSGLGTDSTTVNLGEGESTTELFEMPTTEGDIGGYTLEVSTEDDTGSVAIEIQEGQLFTEPLPGFQLLPRNTGELDPNLVEDVDGDGDGLEPAQSVNWWSQLVQNPQEFDDLTQEQVDALDWNSDGQLTPADAVQLWSQQVQAGS